MIRLWNILGRIRTQRYGWEALPNVLDQLPPVPDNDHAEICHPRHGHDKPFEMLRLEELLPRRAYRRIEGRAAGLQAACMVEIFEDSIPDFLRDTSGNLW